jgi:translation initiation factor 4G
MNKLVGENLKGSRSAVSEVGSDDEAAGSAMSEADVKAKIEQEVKAFFSHRMLDKAESYFSTLPTEYRHLLVYNLAMKSVMKDPDVDLVSDLFSRVREKGLCSPRTFERGFSGLVEILDDLVVGNPDVFSFFATLSKGSGLDQHQEVSLYADLD